MKKKLFNSQYNLRVIDSCIESGFKLQEELDDQYRELLKAAEQKHGDEFAGQEATNQHQLHYEQAMEEWMEKIEDQLKRVIQKFDWVSVFGKNLTTIDDHVKKLHQLKDRLGLVLSEEELSKKLLTIVAREWAVINNENNMSVILSGTQSGTYIEILEEAHGEPVDYSAMLAHFGLKVGKKQESKVCGNFKYNFLKKLTEIQIPKASQKLIIKVKNGHSLNLEYVDIR